MSRPHPVVFVLLVLALSGEKSFGQIVPATTVQLPTFGVAIDAEGVLSVKEFHDPDGRLLARRLAVAKAALDGDLAAPAKFRKISLTKLEQAVRKKIDAGEAPDDVMRHLAGLQRIQYVFFFPDERDIVVAGPAEGWAMDLSGRAVGITSGRPVLLLEDLIVALRAYGPESRKGQFIGCTIDPDRDGLSRLREFQQTIPSTIPQDARDAWAARIGQGLKEALGRANIRVFGISEKTHFAQVLLEADYRMKRIGVGLEPPPVKMATFIGMLKQPSQMTLQRWWFTPNYECVKVTKDRLAMELVGEGVQLLGEDKLIGADGSLAAAGPKPGKASELFTTSFTEKYGEIAAKSPVYAQMRNLIDVIIAAAFIRQEDYYGRAGWTLGVFANEDALPVETLVPPRHVDCAVNVLWKGNRLLAPAGGGVSIRPDQALEEGQLIPDADGQLAAQYGKIDLAPAKDRWWWD